MTDAPQNQDRLFWLGFGLSLAVHIGVAAHLLWRAAPDFGATRRATRAISVNIEATDVLDAVEQSAAKEAAAANAAPRGASPPVPDTEPAKAEAPPQAEPDAPPSAPQAEDARRREEDALRQAADAERQTQQAEQRARDQARQLAEEQARARREAETRDAEARRRAEQAKQAERRARDKRARAAASSGAKGAESSGGRVSASQGDLQNYRGIVDAWIARHKPSVADRSGHVIVSLALSPSGALISASILSSSGSQALDQIALGAVRGAAPFPTPPAGSTARQLRFRIPYRFQ